MRDDELDRLIDAGLSAYAEPRAGIEGRVLAVIAAERDRAPQGSRSAGWRLWAVAISTAACVLIAVLVGLRFVGAPHSSNEQAVNSHQEPRANRMAVPETKSKAPVRTAAKHRSRRYYGVQKQHLPKQALFPTPQPLSPEMQALVQYAAGAPEKDRQSLVQAQAQMDAPLTIAPLHIEPLNESSKDGN